jgi:hypothetical protein
MTEAEWLTCSDAVAMLAFIDRKVSDRKLRLFACGCCRRVWELLPDERSRKAVESAERFADRSTTLAELMKARSRARDVAGCEYHIGDPPAVAHAPVFAAAGARYRDGEEEDVWFRNAAVNAASASSGRSTLTEHAAQAELLRELFGTTPLHPGEPEPGWLTWTVLVLAQGIYDNRAFDRMPILADALQDAGCDNEGILHHCRQLGEHVRGCWVVDLLLGKE